MNWGKGTGKILKLEPGNTEETDPSFGVEHEQNKAGLSKDRVRQDLVAYGHVLSVSP